MKYRKNIIPEYFYTDYPYTMGILFRYCKKNNLTLMLPVLEAMVYDDNVYDLIDNTVIYVVDSFDDEGCKWHELHIDESIITYTLNYYTVAEKIIKIIEDALITKILKPKKLS